MYNVNLPGDILIFLTKSVKFIASLHFSFKKIFIEILLLLLLPIQGIISFCESTNFSNMLSWLCDIVFASILRAFRDIFVIRIRDIVTHYRLATFHWSPSSTNGLYPLYYISSCVYITRCETYILFCTVFTFEFQQRVATFCYHVVTILLPFLCFVVDKCFSKFDLFLEV